jgi:8-hydroxy-5-deazaflavin:NADPH oxidoreductase
MNISILGTGIVAQVFAKALLAKGHQVQLGTRDAKASLARTEKGMSGETLSSFLQANPLVKLGSFQESAAFGEIIVNATNGAGSIAALELAQEKNLNDKILIDIANPLDFSKGMPPTLFIVNDNSLGEEIQKRFPKLKVVKTLNTMSCEVMVDPARVRGDHTAFVSGNDASAKAQVTNYLVIWFGWKPTNIIDVGNISTARGTEQLLPLWIRLFGAFQHANFNFHIAK